MSKIENALSWALNIANDNSHGYSQTNRWGPDYDCSSFVISALEQAGIRVKSAGASYTGNMRSVLLSCGFKDVTNAVSMTNAGGMERGDVLLNDFSHVAFYLGGGRIVHARSSEGNSIPGDQSGNEIRTQGYFNFPWTTILRYNESGDYSQLGHTPAVEAPVAEESPVVNGIYTVKKGDTLSAIAQKYLGASYMYADIMRWNGLSNTNIYVGQKLSLVKKEIPIVSNIGEHSDTYVVKSGDTLSAIALKFLGNAALYPKIKQWNNLRSDNIRVGQTLIISEPKTQDPPAVSEPNTSNDKTYTVKKGDTLWGIAQKYLGSGLKYGEIKRANNLSSDKIYEGQVIKLP